MSGQAPDCHNCGRSRSDEFPTTSVAGRLAGTPFVGWLAVFWTRHYCAPGRAEQAYVTNEVTHFKFTRPRAENAGSTRHPAAPRSSRAGKSIQRPSDLEASDANLHTGAVNGGTSQLYQQL